MPGMPLLEDSEGSTLTRLLQIFEMLIGQTQFRPPRDDPMARWTKSEDHLMQMMSVTGQKFAEYVLYKYYWNSDQRELFNGFPGKFYSRINGYFP